MKKLLNLLFISILFFSCKKNDSSLTEQPKEVQMAQAQENLCSADDLLQQEITANPKRMIFLNELEKFTENYKGRNLENARIAGKLYVPVVIHIVLPDPASITNEAIIAQIGALKRDFNKLNPELSNSSVYLAGYPLSSVADCQIEFYVTDIVQKQSNLVFTGATGNDVKNSAKGGDDPIDPTTKLNIWVSNNNGVSWAQFPGGNLATDGIVLDYRHFGYNLNGEVAAHEAGHWLNLRHIWGDRQCGDDYVKDTPTHFGPTSGCPAEGSKSSCKNKPLLQFMNHMDYGPRSCKYMFTAGQKNRMDAAIDNARKPYFSITKVYTDLFP